MISAVQFTPQAVEDLDDIWLFIAQDNQVQVALGVRRQDLTPLAVRFWTVTKFPNYVVVYRPETSPLQVTAILHGKRDLREVLEGRS